MTEKNIPNEDADKLAEKAFKVLLASLSVWPIVWFIAVIVSNDGWAIIAGFFMGLVATGLISIVPGLMALASLRDGTQYKSKAKITAAIGFSLFIVVLLLYAL